jgi:methionyl-tRNA formyltransferase
MTSMRIVYAGTPEFAVPALRALIESDQSIVAVYTQPDRPAGRGRVLTASPVKQCALDHGIPVEQPLTFRNESAVQQLVDYRADVMIVAAYGLILPQVVLDAPRLGCINIHASLLPRWRGAAPIQRAILAGDTQTGITLMRMEAGLDTGPMLMKRVIEIGSNESAAELHDRLAMLSVPMLQELLIDLPASLRNAQPQPGDGVTYAKKILKEEARINWSQSAQMIHSQIRAFNAWPVAETTLHDKQLRIWKAGVIQSNTDAQPGTVIASNVNGIQVATGRGVINILQLQLAGRNTTVVEEFIKSHSLTGVVLGANNAAVST